MKKIVSLIVVLLLMTPFFGNIVNAEEINEQDINDLPNVESFTVPIYDNSNIDLNSTTIQAKSVKKVADINFNINSATT